VYESKAGTSVLAAHLFAQSARQPGAPPLVLALREDPSRAAHARFLEFEATALPEDLPALARVVARGFRLDAATFEPARRAALEAATEAEADTAAVLAARARSALFGPTSPLGRKPWADEPALAGLSEAEVGTFAKAFLSPARTELSVAGPLDPEAVRKAFESAFAEELPHSRPRAAASTPASPFSRLAAAQGPPTWTVTPVERKDASQNTLHVVLAGDRSRPHDPAATMLLLYLLGETFYSGRLGRALVEPGLVYSVWTTLQEAPGLPGYLLVQTAASKENSAEVLRRIRSVLEEAARGPFTRAELEEAKAYLRGKEARQRDGALSAARTGLDRSPSDPSPQTVTLEQLNDTARRLLTRGAPQAFVGGPGE
jgi:predicted Zn-dependent peptidase